MTDKIKYMRYCMRCRIESSLCNKQSIRKFFHDNKITIWQTSAEMFVETFIIEAIERHIF